MVRILNGLPYEFHSTWDRKRSAKFEAQKLRKRHLVRVIKTHKGYSIFVHYNPLLPKDRKLQRK